MYVNSGKKPTGYACGGWVVPPGWVWAIEKRLPSHNCPAAMARSRREGKEADERGKLITHQVGLHVPHSLDTQAQAQGALPAEQARGGRPGQGALREEGVRGRGGSVRGDHVHACVRIPPKLAVSNVMGYVKGKSAMALRDRHPEWGRVVGKDKTFWARGHCVSTVGLNEETIRRYVAEQEDGSRFE